MPQPGASLLLAAAPETATPGIQEWFEGSSSLTYVLFTMTWSTMEAHST